MKVFYAGSATKEDMPEVVMEKKKNTGVLLTYFDIYYKKSITCKRMRRLKKRNEGRKEHKIYESSQRKTS